MENYSLSDMAAVSGANDGWGNNSFMWIFALLILMFGGGGFGFGNNRDYGTYATAASQQEILYGQQFQNLDNKIDRIGNGIADATFSLNNTINNEGRALQTQLSNCCCENQRNVDALRYDMAQSIASVNATTTAQTQKILDTMAQNKIESLQAEVNSLRTAQEIQNATCGVVKYPMASTYSSGANPFCSCGCNC